MKKILIVLVILYGIFGGVLMCGANCQYSEGSDLSSFLEDCQPSTVVGGEEMTLEGGLRDKVRTWIANAGVILGVLAVGALVFAGLLMQFSAGEDEKTNKAKKIVTRTLLGVVILISAGGIIYLIINVMFGLGDK